MFGICRKPNTFFWFKPQPMSSSRGLGHLPHGELVDERLIVGGQGSP